MPKKTESKTITDDANSLRVRPPSGGRLQISQMLLGCLLLALLLPGGASAQVEVSNLGLAADFFVFDDHIGQRLVAFTVSESRQGEDLNGDGDFFDRVLHLFDPQAGTTTNLGLHIFRISSQGGLVAFSLLESDRQTDLNNDGDFSEFVLHVLDTASGSITNLALASRSISAGQGIVAFAVSEASQGEEDLNGNGSTRDFVIHVFDANTGTITNSGESTTTFLARERLVFFQTSDGFLHVFEPATGTTSLGFRVNLSDFAVEGDLVALRVSERLGHGDLNGDGDASDSVVYVFDASTGVTTNLALAVNAVPRIDGDQVFFVVSESLQGRTDLNGDGDASDFLLHKFDAATGSVTNLGINASSIQAEGGLVAIAVNESSQLGDLNADLDRSDRVLHVLDAGTGNLTNLALGFSRFTSSPEFRFQISDGFVAFAVSESAQRSDLNADLDTNDFVLHLYDAAKGVVTNLGLDVLAIGAEIGSIQTLFELEGDLLAFSVREREQGSNDLNGDGDMLDSVFHLFDASTGATTNLGLALSGDAIFRGFQIKGGLAVFSVQERAQGNTDLNADGDASDGVFHVARFAPDPPQATQDAIDALQDIIDGNPGTPLADKLEDALDKLQTALDEFDKDPPDNQAAIGNIEGAVGDIEAAVNDGLMELGQGTELLDQLAMIARQIAVDALEAALAEGGEADEIADAQEALAEGGALKSLGAFKGAVNKYKDALAKAESAVS